ncbi:MAG TPA: DAK2 domain-containing protein [Chloroflexota bacterium]|nr:DAK2 domain-containing protein [Chloroflexota bacterium]
MARQAARSLELELPVINALNVFPVPDGDTGTNMLATVREALSCAAGAATLREAVDKLAQGAMLGARGNSGVILSQLFRAQQQMRASHSPSDVLTSVDLAGILARASDLAAGAVANPVEGTMLSVLRAAASVPPAGDFLGEVLRAGEAALAATPDQLPILREAGVVDSGGFGLLTLLRGWYEAITGQPAPSLGTSLLGVERAREQAAAGVAHPADLLARREHGYGYCVTLLVETPDADEAAIRERLLELGDSVLVAAVSGQLKLHVHVPDPETAIAFARELGTISRSEVSNIDEQVGGLTIPVVAVASGEGLARVFRSLGAGVVSGGQTQNPSTAELLAACEKVPAPVFLLPNNRNVLAAAKQAAAAREGILVVRTESIPQGVAATLAYDTRASADDNLVRMGTAAAGVISAELAPAARSATLAGIHVEPGQMLVLIDGKLVGVDDAGLAALGEHIRQAGSELITIYYGAAAVQADADRLAAAFPDLQVEIVRGDQPHATFILGFE